MRQNLILASLPPAIQVRLAPLFHPVSLSGGVQLFGLGDVVQHAYFPTAGLISLLGTTADGGTVEVAAIARDGVIGSPAQFRTERAPHAAVVRLAGGALRVSAAVLRGELARHDSLRSAVQDYACRSAAELAQAVVCQCFHNVTERFSRWLLMASDRTGSDVLALTQDSIAQSLGVARPVLTRAALELQDAGAIRYRYGRLVIASRTVLERLTCECHELNRT